MLHINIDTDMYYRLQQLAKDESRTVSEQLNFMIEFSEFVKEYIKSLHDYSEQELLDNLHNFFEQLRGSRS